MTKMAGPVSLKLMSLVARYGACGIREVWTGYPRYNGKLFDVKNTFQNS